METYNLLTSLQQKMAACIKSVGNIEHDMYPQTTPTNYLVNN